MWQASRSRLQSIVRDVLLLAITGLSWKITAARVREATCLQLGPILEVAKLFVGIFITIIPAIAILRAGNNGGAGAIGIARDRAGRRADQLDVLLAIGALSSFLDNAPTYLVFFNLAGGDPKVL